MNVEERCPRLDKRKKKKEIDRLTKRWYPGLD